MHVTSLLCTYGTVAQLVDHLLRLSVMSLIHFRVLLYYVALSLVRVSVLSCTCNSMQCNLPSTPSPADTMYIVLNVVGEIIVHHMPA